MAAKLSVRVVDGRNTELGKLSNPLTRDTFQKLSLPVDVDGKTVMVEVTIDLTGLNDD